MANQAFFEYLLSLLKGAHLDTAIQEVQFFLERSKQINQSNAFLVADIEAKVSDLVLYQSQLSLWNRERHVTDSRTSDTEIRRIYNLFVKFIDELKKLPEIGYNEFGKVSKSESVNIPGGMAWGSKWQKISQFFVLTFILLIFGVLAYNIYQAFFPKSDEPIDNTRCWVKTQPVFAELMNEPSFMSQNVITELPGNKKYHVLEIKTVEMGVKCYKIKDHKLNVEGWLAERSLSQIHSICFSTSLTSIKSVDKTKCWITTGEFTQVYHRPEHMPQEMAQLQHSKDYQVLAVQKVSSSVFFKIKDEESGIEGWIRNFGLEFVSINCF